MKLLDILKSQHDERNEGICSGLRRDLSKKHEDLVKLGLEASNSIVITLSAMLKNLKQIKND